MGNWGIQFPPRPKNEPHVLLECRACHKQDLWSATALEREVLERTGIIALNCSPCGKPTYWTFIDPSQRPPGFAHAEAVAPPPRVMPAKQFVERRKRKRMQVGVPVLVRTPSGEEEIGKTENLSNVGLAVLLCIDLKEGEIVSVFCPYTAGGQNIEQKAKVRWRDPYPAGPKRFYGLCYKI
jgi:hypothetical protein